MHAKIPKQFININGKPVLYHTILCFYNFIKTIPVILVLPEPYIDYWNSITKKIDLNIHHQVVKGGKTRFHSVKNGLELINESGLVAIHDGVRPLVSEETLQRVFLKAEKEGNAIPAIPVTESMRKVNANHSEPVNREEYRLIQTPQCFHTDLIKKAYEQEFNELFTDDASVAEASGIKINLVDGNQENIKITRPGDLKIAEALLR